MGRNYIVCVKSERDGNTYCYDAERKKWVIVSEQDVGLKQVPEDALQALIDRAVFSDGEAPYRD